MTPPNQPTPAVGLADRVTSASIDSRADFQTRVRDALVEAADVGCPVLWLADADFAAWPLGELAVVEALGRWSRQPHRRLHLLAADFEAIFRLHPRWVGWRRQWAQQVECRMNTEVEPARMPTLLIAPGRFSLRLFDPGRFRGRFCRDGAEALRDREAFDAVLQQSQPAFPATVTGL